MHVESAKDNLHKLQGRKSQLDLHIGTKLFMVRAGECGPSVLEELWNQWFAAVQKPLGPPELRTDLSVHLALLCVKDGLDNFQRILPT